MLSETGSAITPNQVSSFYIYIYLCFGIIMHTVPAVVLDPFRTLLNGSARLSVVSATQKYDRACATSSRKCIILMCFKSCQFKH